MRWQQRQLLMHGLLTTARPLLGSTCTGFWHVWLFDNSLTSCGCNFQVYYSSPKRCCQWFNGELGYEYYPEEDGTVADWIISLVNIRFQEHDAKQPTRYVHASIITNI